MLPAKLVSQLLHLLYNLHGNWQGCHSLAREFSSRSSPVFCSRRLRHPSGIFIKLRKKSELLCNRSAPSLRSSKGNILLTHLDLVISKGLMIFPCAWCVMIHVPSLVLKSVFEGDIQPFYIILYCVQYQFIFYTKKKTHCRTFLEARWSIKCFFFHVWTKINFIELLFLICSCQMCVVPKPREAEVDCDELKASRLLSMQNKLRKKLKTLNYICET